MRSRLSRLGVLTVVAGLGLLGCEHWRNGLRKDGGGSTEALSAAPNVDDPRTLHEPGGKLGGLSDRSREIERNLNVGQ
jgi:hypothetical protein